MSDSNRIQLLIVAWSIVGAYLIVVYWRHIVFWLFQVVSVVIACIGLLSCIVSSLSTQPEWVRDVDQVLGGWLAALPQEAMGLFVAMLLFGGIPLMVLFRGACFYLFPWLRIFSNPPELRDAILESGVRLPRRRSLDDLSRRFLIPHAIGLGLSIAVLGPLLLLSINGSETATRLLKTLSTLGMLLFFLAMSSLAARGNGGDN